VKTEGFHAWKKSRTAFSTAREQAVENSLLDRRDAIPGA